MIEVITAIAMLCQVSPSTGVDAASASFKLAEVDEYQLKCQQEYVACIKKSGLDLARCVLERKVK